METTERKDLTVAEFEKELKQFVEDRASTNPHFSIRSMALKFGVLDSTLQKVIRGERNLGFRLAKDLAQHFNVEIIKDKTKKVRGPTRWKLNVIDPDSETHISWVNLAILEMIKLKDFNGTEAWIAKRLGLSLQTVQEVIRKMESQQMLTRTSKGWKDCMDDAAVAANGPITSKSIRLMQKDLLSISQQKVDSVSYDEREHTFTIFPVPRSQIKNLKKKVLEFSWAIAESAQKSRAPKEEVYALQLSLFPLTQKQD
ncbi:MAG: TIGR02147 family protein [Bdellovibrionota bacterium]